MWPDVKEGLRWVVGHRWLRAIATCTGVANFFSSLLFALACRNVPARAYAKNRM
jgi:hypothetical protein